MSVELDPVELGFKRPFTTEVSQVLRLKNPHSDPVAFKVKTTAPKQYCVRPNSGRIEAGKDVEVQVLLQAMKEDPPPDAKCRDKFLVQSVAVTADKEFSNVASIWSHIEQTSKSSIQEKKIRVFFLPADDATATPAKTNGVKQQDDESTLLSPSPEAVTPQRGSTATPVGSISRPQDRPAESKHLGDAVASAHNPVTSGQQSTLGATVAGVASAIPTSTSDLQAQLAEARAQIQKLKQQVEQHGLRQRKGEAIIQESKEKVASGTMGIGVQHPPTGGVPVQIVAALCLLSFLLAYFFF